MMRLSFVAGALALSLSTLALAADPAPAAPVTTASGLVFQDLKVGTGLSPRPPTR
jgi:Spy/CpxP family protein refolding chaperone